MRGHTYTENVFANQSTVPGSHFAIMASEKWEKEAKSCRRRLRGWSDNKGKESGWLRKWIEEAAACSEAYG